MVNREQSPTPLKYSRQYKFLMSFLSKFKTKNSVTLTISGNANGYNRDLFFVGRALVGRRSLNPVFHHCPMAT